MMSPHPPKDERSLVQRWVPHPLLTVTLTLIWLLLANGLSIGGLLVGVVLGLSIPRITASFWPDRPHIQNYGKAFAYVLLVIYDIIVANIQVAMIILFRPLKSLNTCWVCVPLDLTNPEAITVFAGTITMTPGTVSCDLSADGRALLVHCLDAADPEAAVSDMKTRYEARLKEIFP
ncbi:MAG: Na+/H+ antiporter subunit E [Betaproteobacteria bacterium HGW-Betaproteobacteria-7]|jgi:multicomponent K+:H+ antiporter subunit E|nr:MAG: Na+/H+ antiporter subunit E [Betaproteobacteria bacterium HGW-Betaproteobacteria-7]